jgi:hypothetical protein
VADGIIFSLTQTDDFKALKDGLLEEHFADARLIA